MNTCTHSEATRMFKAGSATIWAGSAEELTERGDWALVISAIGYTKFTLNPITHNETAKALLPHELFTFTPPPCVGIDWPDYNAPVLGRSWWHGLVKALPKIEGDVGICCQGGHGRTGTILSILAPLLGKVKKGKCPVEWVREHYCEKACESHAQLNYVQSVTQREVTADVSKAFVVAHHPTPASLPGLARAQPPTLTSATGTAGERPGIVVGDDPSEEELLEAWFEINEDNVKVISLAGKISYMHPVWDDTGELVGWQDVTTVPAPW